MGSFHRSCFTMLSQPMGNCRCLNWDQLRTGPLRTISVEVYEFVVLVAQQWTWHATFDIRNDRVNGELWGLSFVARDQVYMSFCDCFKHHLDRTLFKRYEG